MSDGRRTTPVPAEHKVPLKHGLVHAFETVMYWSGAGNLYVRARRDQGAMILMYHSVSREPERRYLDPASTLPVEVFEAQMRFLARFRRVVPLGDVVGALEHGRALPAGTVAITFDDGYRDVLNVAAPILEHYELPAALYLATGYIERGENQWVDQLYLAMSSRTRDRLFVGKPHNREFVLTRPDDVDGAYDAIRFTMMQLSEVERHALLDQISLQLRPSWRAPRLTLNWAEVKELARRYPNFELCAHSRDHVDLAGCSTTTLRHELTSCIADLERELGVRPAHFSYPYGSFSARAAREIENLGLRSAALTAPAFPVTSSTSRFALPRLSPPPKMSLFRLYTSGVCPLTHELIEKLNELKLGVQRI